MRLINDVIGLNIITTTTGNEVVYNKLINKINFNVLRYELSKKHVVKPYNIRVEMQQSEDVYKTSLTAKYSINYKEKRKGFDARFFAGAFVATSANDAGAYRFRMSGQAGYQDYLFNHTYLGRNETNGVWAKQFTETDGAFKIFSPLGQSAEWLMALNLKSSLGNLKLPLNVYIDMGVSAPDGRLAETLLYNAGASLSIYKNVFEIYFPILFSQGFTDYHNANGIDYVETIRFVLNFNLLNPFEAIRNLEL